MVDYKKLLEDYIDLVSGMEGTDFIPKNFFESTGYGFSEEELEALWECAKWDSKEMRYTR